MTTPIYIEFPQATLTIVTNEHDATITLDDLKETLSLAPHTININHKICASLNSVLDIVKDTHQYIEAAGGVVYNEHQQMLLIFRRGYWDLPKGKIDEGENAETAALREVEEETGVNSLKIINPIGSTYHTYFMYNTYVIKKTHWYCMAATNSNTLVPQMEEDIEMAKWINKEELPDILKQTYPNIKTILAKVLDN